MHEERFGSRITCRFLVIPQMTENELRTQNASCPCDWNKVDDNKDKE